MNNKRMKKKLTLALDESGTVAIVIALVLTALCGFVALAFDIGHLVMVKAELQRTADAAALAGVTGLVPYNNPGPDQIPNWVAGEAKARKIINDVANKADAQRFSLTEGIVLPGYWLLKPPAGYVQTPPVPPLPTVRPITTAYLPEPAITVQLTRTVPLYLAPIFGISSPKTVTATATACLPECYSITNVVPIAVDTGTVYNNTTDKKLVIDLVEQNIKPQSNKGVAGWFNLSGDNNVPSVRINTPLTSAQDQIYMAPGTMATLTDLIAEGETIVMPIVDDVSEKVWKDIIGWSAFKVDTLNANSMEGHFVEQYFDPNVLPTSGTPSPLPAAVSATPKLVG